MPVIYAAALRTARMQAVLDAIAGGDIQLGTAGFGTVLATIPLATPAGTLDGDVITFTVPRQDTSADASGTIAEARIRNSGGTVQISGLTAGTGGGNNVVTDSATTTVGQTVTLIATSTLTHNTAG